MSLNNSKILTPVSQNIFTTSNIRFIPVPSILTSTVGNNDNLKVFVNGVRLYEEANAFTKAISGSNLTITFNPGTIGYNVETTAFEVAIIGKFIDL